MQIVNISNQKQIIRIGSNFCPLKDIAFTEADSGKLTSHPIIGEGWKVRDDITDFGNCVIGRSGDKILVGNPTIADAIQIAADENGFLIGSSLTELKRLGVKLGVDHINPKTDMYVDNDMDGEVDCYTLALDYHDYYWEFGYPLPHGDQLPIPDFTFSFTRTGETEEGKHIYTLRELEHTLGNCLCAIADAIKLRGIRIKATIGGENMAEKFRNRILSKEQQSEFFHMLDNVNNRIAAFEKNL